MEHSHNSKPKKVIAVKEKWMKVRATMDAAAAGHVVLEVMFPRVKLERKNIAKGVCSIDW